MKNGIQFWKYKMPVSFPSGVTPIPQGLATPPPPYIPDLERFGGRQESQERSAYFEGPPSRRRTPDPATPAAAYYRPTSEAYELGPVFNQPATRAGAFPPSTGVAEARVPVANLYEQEAAERRDVSKTKLILSSAAVVATTVAWTASVFGVARADRKPMIVALTAVATASAGALAVAVTSASNALHALAGRRRR